MTTTTRAFVALTLPAAALDVCVRAQDELRRSVPRALAETRWTTADQMHVTVKFLGNVSPEQEAGARELARATAVEPGAPVSSIRGLGAFPTPRRARVLVVELAADPTLTGLMERVERGASQLGVAAEQRSFRPHVTLARLRRPGNVERWVAGVVLASATFRFEELVLFRSDLGADGARYTPLVRVSLAG